MKVLLTNPVVLICSGIIVIGLVGLFWAIAKFRKLPSGLQAVDGTDDLLPSVPDLRDIDFRAPNAQPPIPSRPGGVASPVSRDVAERLENMSQRLAEMQTVLTKQSSSAANAPGSAAP